VSPRPSKKMVFSYKKQPDQRMTREQRYIIKIAIVTELSRFIRGTVNDVFIREELMWKLIDSLDYSDTWLATVADMKLGQLKELLVSPNWHDVEDGK
jgi:hypothetical protein